MVMSLYRNQLSPTYKYLQPALVQGEHCQKYMEWILLHSLLHLEVLGVPIWRQRVGRLSCQHIQQPSLGTWDYGRGKQPIATWSKQRETWRNNFTHDGAASSSSRSTEVWSGTCYSSTST
jgi:hypothetical protein